MHIFCDICFLITPPIKINVEMTPTDDTFIRDTYSKYHKACLKRNRDFSVKTYVLPWNVK